MIYSLQSLRGIFAIMIFLHHYTIDGKGLFEAGGSCGVAFFLTLSGFVMSAGYEKKAEEMRFQFSKYFLKRIIRIYPLHFLCLAVFLGIHLFSISIKGILAIFPNILLLQSWFPLKGIYFSGNAVSWCLSDLMFFYAIFPFLIHFVSHNLRAFFYTLSIVVILYLSLVHFIPYKFQHPLIYINPLFRLIDFSLGVALWQIWIWFSNKISDARIDAMSFSLKSIIELFPLALVTISILLYPHCAQWFNLTSLWWIPCLSLIFIFTLFNRRGGVLTIFMNCKPLVTFGDFSFSFYMIHVLCIQVISGIFRRIDIEFSQYFQLGFTLIVTIALAWIIYTYFEKPISKSLLKKFHLSK